MLPNINLRSKGGNKKKEGVKGMQQATQTNNIVV